MPNSQKCLVETDAGQTIDLNETVSEDGPRRYALTNEAGVYHDRLNSYQAVTVPSKLQEDPDQVAEATA